MSFLDVEIDVMSRPIESSVQARWERKGSVTGRGDRFIPNALNRDVAELNLYGSENTCPNDMNSLQMEFNNQLAKNLFAGDDLNSKILSYTQKAPKPSEAFTNQLRVLYTQNKEQNVVKRAQRHISSAPERILDAPDLLDDYYLNLVDWSSTNNLAIALGTSVYLWNPCGTSELLIEGEENGEVITSVSWMADGSHLAIGTANNDVQLWNVERKKRVRSMKGHQARVGALAWNNHVLSSGSRDSMILHHDVRVAQHLMGSLKAHQQEVCGLKWSLDGTQLASGGNDNMLCIWDANSATPRFTMTDSQAAVKALAWCPWQTNLLATGSGTADRHIRFYNTSTGALLNSIDTGSQVCSLVWGKHEKEILSAHGFSQNQLTLWKYPSMAKVADFTGHTSRVLHMSLSADGTTVCSAGADETLRFWRMWEQPQKAKAAPITARSALNSINIR